VVAVTLALAGAAALRGPTATPLAVPGVDRANRPTYEAREAEPLCRPTLQAEIDAAPGVTVDLRGCSYTGGATIDRSMTVIGGIVHVPPGEAGIIIEADGVTLDGVTLIGTQAQTFVFEEIGVLAHAPPDDPIRRLTIRDSTIASFGGFGTYLRNVSGVRLEGNKVRDVVYAGLMVLSGDDGIIDGNVVQRIGVVGAEANKNNAYGIVLTAHGGDEPMSTDFTVIGNTVEDVPTWHAFDTHGGRRITFTENTVRRSMRGIFVTTDGTGSPPEDITIVGNQLLSPAPVDSNLAAITLYRADVVAIVGNTAAGWGEGNFLRDFEEQSTRVIVTDNTVEP
jgi:hypothetical protein